MRVVFGAEQPGSTSNPENVDVAKSSRTNERAIPSAELARPNVAANLAARVGGLSSPAAPPEGDLGPRASGWLIGTGTPHEQFTRWAKRCLIGTPFVTWLVQFPGMFKSPLVAGLVLGASFVGVLAACIAIVQRAGLRRQFKLARQVVCLRDVPRGTLVRVTGTIGEQATVPTLFRGVPAVLFRNRIVDADETRGQDFLLDLDQGEQARVAVRRSYLLETPKRTHEPPACGPVGAHRVDGRWVLQSDLFVLRWFRSRDGRYESSVGPGDRVEVCGIVEDVLDPAMERRSPRQAPIRPVLMAGEKTPLLVRRA